MRGPTPVWWNIRGITRNVETARTPGAHECANLVLGMCGYISMQAFAGAPTHACLHKETHMSQRNGHGTHGPHKHTVHTKQRDVGEHRHRGTEAACVEANTN